MNNSSLRPADYGYITVTGLLTPSVLSLSTLVIVAIGKFKKLQTPTNFLIASLASADILVALLLPVFTTSLLLQNVMNRDLMCLFPNRLLILSCGASILSLAAVAFDRYIALSNSLEYVQIITKGKTFCMIGFAWVYSGLVVSVPVGFVWTDSSWSRREGCGFGQMHPRIHLLFASMLFFPACGIIFFCYYKIFSIAKHHNHAIHDQENMVTVDSVQMRYVKRDCKYAKTLAVLVIVFIVFWFPFQFIQLLVSLTDFDVDGIILNYFVYLAAFNSLMNPWLYAYKNTSIRSAFRKISMSVSSAFRRTSRHVTPSCPDDKDSCSSENKLDHTDSRLEEVDIMQMLDLNLNSDMFAEDCWAYEPKKVSVHSVGSTITQNGKKIVVPSLVIEDMEGTSPDINQKKESEVTLAGDNIIHM